MFGIETRAQLKKATAGIKAEVPVTADTKPAVASVGKFRAWMAKQSARLEVTADTSPAITTVEALKARMETLGDKLAELRLTANGKQAEAEITRVQARMAALAKTVANVTMSADTKKLDAQIVAKIAELKKLQQQMTGLKMDADDKAAKTKIAGLERQAANLQKSLSAGSIKGDINIQAAKTKIAALEAQIALLKNNARDITLVASNVSALRNVAVLKAEIASLQKQARDIRLGGSVDAAAFQGAVAQLLGYEAALEKLTPAVDKGDVALGAFAKTITGTGRGWGILTGQVTLFGGVLNRVLPVIASSVAVWHVAADAVIEFAAVWIPAGLAVAAFAVAASDAATAIVQRMQAVHTVMDATGRSVAPMTNALETLHKAVQPQVYQLFGDALTVMNSRAGTFALVAKATGTVLDQLGARIVAAVTGTKQLGTGTQQLSGFWKTAVIDVSKLGDSIGNLFGVFGNFFKAIPGFATGLLTIGDDFTKILESASAALVPVIKWTLLLHGYILYTGLAVSASLAFIGALANLARQFVTFAASSVLAGVGALKAFGSALVSIGLALAAYVESIIVADGASASFAAALAPLAANPMIWVTAAAIALGALVAWLVTSKTAAQNFNAAMQQTITNASLASLQSTLQLAAAQTAAKLASANQDLNKALSQQGPAVTGAATRWSSNYSPAVDRAATSVHQLTAGQQQIADQAALVSGRIGALSKQYGGNTQALGALVAAGITSAQITSKNKDVWAQALIQVNSTTAAYQAMGSQAGVLGNDLDVLGRTVTDQYTAVQKLNQAWSAFIGDVTGTQGSFDTVAQGFFTLADHSAKLTFSLGKLKVSYADNKAAIDSLTPAGIALNQAFGDQVVNIDKLFASWRTAGLAGNQFTAGVKDAIAPMVRYAAGSQEATAQLVALAQEAGYQGPISLQALTKWLGNTHGATQKLKDITNQATTQEALLTGAMQDQGTFIANQLIGDINSAILAYNGVGKAAAAYGLAIAQFGKNSAPAIAAQKTLVDAIVKSGMAAGDGAKTIEATLAKVLGISMPAAARLFNASMVSTGLAAAAASAQAKAAFATSTASITGDFAKQLAAAKNAGGAVNAYTDAIRSNGVTSGEAKAARQQLITDMVGAGVKATTAKADVAAYTTAIQQNGINSSQAAGARAKLISDILAASNNAKQGKTDLANYSASVRQNGTDSDATRSARQKLITDLINSGVSAKTATGLVDGLSTSIGRLHGATAQIIVNASGTGQIAITGTGWALGQGNVRFHAAQGGLVSMGSGPVADDVPAMLSKGELVVPAKMVRAGAVDNLRGQLPGFAAGGFVGVESLLGSAPGDARTIAGNLSGKATSTAITQAIAKITAQVNAAAAKAAAKAAAAAGGGPGSPGPGGGAPAANAALARKLMPAWGSGAEWNAWNALEMQEAGWNQFARNPSSGAYGIPQALPPSKMGAAANPPQSNPTAQIRWMIGYIQGRYGDPIAAEQHELANHWYARGGLVPGYAKGGLIPGMAAGGTVASLRATLAAEQANERAKYFGLSHSYAIGPAKYRTPLTVQELRTLAARQATEVAAYNALAGAGLTTTAMHHLGATARAELSTAGDKELSRAASAGGHPGFAADLRKYLGQISSTASGSVPAGSTGGIPPVPPPPTTAAGIAALRKKLTQPEAGVKAKYFGLEHSFAIGPAKYRTKTVMSELATLTARENAELAAYKAVTTGSMTTAELSHLGAAARAEYTTASDQALSKMPGGHPGFAKDLRSFLAQVSTLTGTKIPGAVGGGTGSTGGGGGTPGPPLPPVKHIYGGDVSAIYNAFGPVLAAALAPFTAQMARGGMANFDSGGTLRPGYNPVWNGTGKNEHLVPAGSEPVRIQLEWAGGGASDELHALIRKHVKVRAGGSVQRAYGVPGTVSGSNTWRSG